jgi:hypothetical protein
VLILAQELLGVIIVCVSLKDTPYEQSKSHYLSLIDGKEYDFTLNQFETNSCLNKERTEKSKDDTLSYPNTKKRFNMLKDRFNLKSTQIN